MKKIKCNLCGKSNTTLLHTFDSNFNPKIKGLRVVKCNKCGFVYTNPQPSPKELATFYPDSLHQGKRKSRLRFLKELYEKKRFRHVLKEAKKTNKNPKNILDIGCSNGFFLKLAKKKGLKIYGTEFGDNQIKHLKKHLTKNTYSNEKQLIGKTKFDIITAFDVIEHLPDPTGFIRNCKKLLNKNGLLVVLTMVFGSWSYKIFKERVGYISDQHLFYFTKGSLEELLEMHGFRIYRTKTYNNTLLHLGLFIYQLITGNKVAFADEKVFYIRSK